MASSDSNDSLSERSESVSSNGSESEEDYGTVDLEANAPYQHEPLAVPGQPQPAFNFEEDPDRIPHDILADRHEGRIRVGNW